ncbi:MAG: ThiF family adenylyltransferase [Saprospiraceae bacterium]|nr:ThiF family adenylyltransferase [Saprospiraceae bacterium]
MKTSPLPVIRFPQGMFPEVRKLLLADREREAFALLLGRRTVVDGLCVIKVVEVVHPAPEDYEGRSLVSIRLKREFVYRQLVRMQQEGDVDTLIDVHTHPFCPDGASFSGVDDRDERNFVRWLDDTLEEVCYGSIVLSQSDYSARVWGLQEGRPVAAPARVKTQIIAEAWPCADSGNHGISSESATEPDKGILARTTLALGLDVMRTIVSDQTIAVVGVGGLGSVIAENLIHMGFQSVQLIDPDIVEITNLNRIVGAYYSDALESRSKVEVVGGHLRRINPDAVIEAHAVGIEDESALPALMRSDWIVVATDNHFSRFHAQKIALQLGVPLISAGVNITVKENRIADWSGEVIVTRSGDSLCLNCLGRINPTLVAAYEYRADTIGKELVNKGYVTGQEVKEPAVKTLNSIVGAMAVDALLNQFTERQRHVPVIVYGSNQLPVIYPDDEWQTNHAASCYWCATTTGATKGSTK